MMQPHRHSLVWLTVPGWEQVQAGAAAETVSIREALSRWRAADWPLVVRRRPPAMAATDLALGIALPPQAGSGIKPRIATIVNLLHVRRVDAPLPLAAVLKVVPAHWRAALLAMHLESLDALPALRVYGSLAWQTITGMGYLTSTSDIDLLVAPATRGELGACLDCLRRYASILPLDGEIVFPSGAAVAWKEWDAVTRGEMPDAGARVLSKYADTVVLVDCSELLASLADTDTVKRS
ncbi:MAG: malonate decarboxylase holo-[acyl-carrier-protein] synthase [Herminiimonas sp.]|nr:malonate decarboxylase holo-[acyl-carrier-protein] synthase [Herminiimonas sp.]